MTTLYKTKDLGGNVIYPTTIFERHQRDSICLRGFDLTNDSMDQGQGFSYHMVVPKVSSTMKKHERLSVFEGN